MPPANDPNQPMYQGYYRGQAPGRGADKLQALADGYFGLNKVFFLNIALAFGARAVTATAKTPEESLTMLLVIVVLMVLIIGLATYPCNKKIGYGVGWQPSGAIVASLLMGINSALCCGIIGYVVMQQIASKEMARYGVKGGAFGLKKAVVYGVIEQIRASAAAPTSPPPGAAPTSDVSTDPPAGPGFHA